MNASTFFESNVASPLMIKPFERLNFVVLFTGITFLCNRMLNALAYGFSMPAWTHGLWTHTIPQDLILKLGSGAILGLCQWLILRRYIPVWKWILATSLISGALDLQKVILDELTNRAMQLVMTDPDINLFSKIALFVTLVLLIPLGFVLGAGYLQRLVLRPYVVDHGWWLFVPMISALVGVIFLGPAYLVHISQIHLPASLSLPHLGTAAIAAPMATQALAFCLLRKRYINDAERQEATLSPTPEIKNYAQIQQLRKHLYALISRIWKTDLEMTDSVLKYLVIVSYDGTIRLCIPLDSSSSLHMDKTPLPALAHRIESDISALESLGPVAKFNVIFRPPATLQVQPRRSLSIVKLSLGVYAAIIMVSVLLGPLSLLSPLNWPARS